MGLITLADPAMGGMRVFSGGNERVPVRLNTKSKYGLDLNNKFFGGAWELMSLSKERMQLHIALTFEFVSKSTPGYKPAVMVWIDVTNCGRESEFPAKTGVYQIASKEFTVSGDGEWLTGIGHVHDGGTKVDLFVNGNLSCSSKQMYSNRRGGWLEPTDGSVIESMVMPPNTHISDVSVCKDWGEVKKGDKVKVIAYYNDTQYMQMKNSKGRLEGQMGIMFTYIGLK
jgi:hypothetical protein